METSDIDNSLPNQSVSRPWQGTMLGVFNIIGLVALGVALVLLIMMVVGGSAMLSEIAQSDLPIGSMFGTIGTFLLVPLILMFALSIFITRGIFKGQKWTIIATMTFTILGLLSSLFNMAIISIAISSLLLYAEIFCLKSPFYNKNKALASPN